MQALETIEGYDNIMRSVISFVDADLEIDFCVDLTQNTPILNSRLIIQAIENTRHNKIKNSRSNKVIRCITEITCDNILYCKELLKFVDELRHVNRIKTSFCVSTIESLTPTIISDVTSGNSIEQEAGNKNQGQKLIRSIAKEIVDQQQCLFNILWDKAIPAEQKIREIEEGILPETIAIIRRPIEALSLAFDLVKIAQEEILVVFSTPNAFRRNVNSDSIPLLLDAAERNVTITFLVPMEKDDYIRLAARNLCNKNKNIKILNIEPSLRTAVTVLIVDRKYSFTAEVRDDSKQTGAGAMGIAMYSTSKPTVMSYVSIFESFLKLTKQYEESIYDLMEKTGELSAVKQYLNDVLNEVQIFKGNKDAD